MSLRSLSKHYTEAKYAKCWSDPQDSTKAAKHKQFAINRYHRAVRRSEREVIAEQVDAMRPEPTVFVGHTYHTDGHGYFEDEHGVWSVTEGRYICFTNDLHVTNTFLRRNI